MARHRPAPAMSSSRHSLAQRHSHSAEVVTDTCAGCGATINLRSDPWIITATRKVAHYGGSFGQACLRKLLNT